MMKKYGLNTGIMAVSLFVLTTMANAQGFFEQPLDNNPAGISVKLPEIEFGQQNEFFSTLLTLQKQNAMIEKLIAREKEITTISDSYMDMGLDFAAPPPNRDLCEQIPPNKVCHFYYKGMYKDYNPVIVPLPEIQNTVTIDDNGDVAVVPPSLDIPKMLSEQTKDEKEQLKESQFAWTNITCKQGECRAVVTPIFVTLDEDGVEHKDINEMYRYTIRVGEELPSGAVIKSISGSGVNVSHNGKETVMEPAPIISAAK